MNTNKKIMLAIGGVALMLMTLNVFAAPGSQYFTVEFYTPSGGSPYYTDYSEFNFSTEDSALTVFHSAFPWFVNLSSSQDTVLAKIKTFEMPSSDVKGEATTTSFNFTYTACLVDANKCIGKLTHTIPVTIENGVPQYYYHLDQGDHAVCEEVVAPPSSSVSIQDASKKEDAGISIASLATVISVNCVHV